MITKYNHHLVIITVPDELWDESKPSTKEKPSKTVGRPTVPYRKVLDQSCQKIYQGLKHGDPDTQHVRRDVIQK